LVIYTERVSPALSPGENRDKTVTARHRETPDRDDEQSECLPVTGWIVVEFVYNITTGESLPTFIWCFMA
jgi:hypothetical protein